MDADSIADLAHLAVKLSTAIEASGFSGVLAVRRGDETVLERAGGLADRGNATPITLNTRLGTASCTKGFTALTIASLIGEGRLAFETRIADLVSEDLPAIDPAVTIEQLLGHTSGVGDYLDEEELDDVDDHILDVPVHHLEGPVDYLPLLNRYPQVDPPGTRFVYNNSGYIMLAIAVERASGNRYHDEVRRRVFEPAAMDRSGFFRSDRLPGDAALGYLADGRTNVFHLPVIGTGDGGAFSTAPDMLRFWDALWAGRIVDRSVVDKMTAPRSDARDGRRYGLGFWVGADGETATLEGLDAGVSFRSGSNPSTGLSYCVMANDSSGVWPLASFIDAYLHRTSNPLTDV